MNYKIKLEIFEGPLDLLLHLIKEEELNIYDIPITRITAQYLEYINLIQELDLDIAGEFLVMAATLMHIKSRMLLPDDPDTVSLDETDPRADLVRRLLEYKAFKDAAEKFKVFEAERAKMFTRVNVEPEINEHDMSLIEVSVFDLISAFAKVLKGIERSQAHEVVRDEFTVSEKVHEIFHYLANRSSMNFTDLFKKIKNKIEAITTFLAVLELVRLREIILKQESQFGEITISRNTKMMQPVGESDGA